MQILVLTPYLSFPLRHGGRIRTWHLLCALSRRHDVVNVTGLAPEDHSTDRLALERLGIRVREAPLAPAFGRLGALERLRKLGCLLAGRSSLVPRFATRELRALVREEVARGADLAVIDHVWMGAYREELGSLPFIFSTHNAESAVLEAKAERSASWRERILARREARALRRFEARLARDAAATFAVSPADARSLQRLAPEAAVHVVPNGVGLDVRHLLPPPPFDPIRALFVGGLDYHPNREAAAGLAQEILPALRRRDPAAEALIVGRGTESERAALGATPGLRILGEIPEIEVAYREASALVVPLAYGGGSRLKIIEAWALGRPVVSTVAGAAGLDAEDGRHLLIAERPEEFADALARLRDEPELTATLIREGRHRAEERHDWSRIESEIAALAEAAAPRAGQPSAPAP